MQVDFEKCTGCGICLDYCPVEAISMQAGKAMIDQETCLECEACVEACPVDAITQAELPVPAEPILIHPVVEQEARWIETTPSRRLAPLMGTALAFVGREIVPRVFDTMISALERRLSQPGDLPAQASQPPPAPEARTRKGKARRRRRRNGWR